MYTRSPDVTSTTVTRVATDPSSVAEWEGLARERDVAPFHRPGWFRCWATAFAGDDLHVLQVRRRGRMVAVLPVVPRRGGWRSATNGHTPGYLPLAVDEDATRALIRSLVDGRHGAFRLESLALSAAERDLWDEELQRGPSRHELVADGGSVWTDVAVGADEVEARLASRFRSQLRYELRRVEARGTVTLEEVAAGPRVTEALATGMRLEVSTWKGREGTAMASLPWVRRFYEELTDWAATNGWLRLMLLWVDDTPVAFCLDLEHAGTRYVLKTGYDAAHADLSPGKLLSRQVVLAAADDPGVHRYDWCGDESRDTRKWGTDRDERFQVTIYPPGMAGTTRRAVDTTEDALADWARAHLPETARARLRGLRAQREQRPSRSVRGEG